MTTSAFSVRVDPGPEDATITIAGEIDLTTLDSLTAARERALADHPTRVRIDLSSVRFVDSVGLKFLIETQRLAQRHGWELQLLPPAEEAMDGFRITGLDKRLPFLARDHASSSTASRSADEDPQSARLDLEITSSAQAPGIARRALRDLPARELGAGPHLETLTLLVSEVVTNAVVHPKASIGQSIGLTITMTRRRTRVEVSDRGAGFAVRPVPADPLREGGGLGLKLVDSATSRWGTATRDRRFTVWFEIDH